MFRKILLLFQHQPKRKVLYHDLLCQYWPTKIKHRTNPVTVFVIGHDGRMRSIPCGLDPGRNFYNLVKEVLAYEGVDCERTPLGHWQLVDVITDKPGDDIVVLQRGKAA